MTLIKQKLKSNKLHLGYIKFKYIFLNLFIFIILNKISGSEIGYSNLEFKISSNSNNVIISSATATF